MSELTDRLRDSKCELCRDALFEIIRLEASIISSDKMAERLRRPRPLFTKPHATAAGRALQNVHSE